ncbi:hypothetical protein TSUD_295530 [Trifolium subterraneum]|uniref:Endonuclease/exonuclease/phosphatase domain-containing protein n=1 Tax=Trifolium subterraneum TaxID=3900 RepID=A0A2Z6M7A9_TRISU|nr:hypothetical protein TSUD_295530 [Trifolium subterraneum]
MEVIDVPVTGKKFSWFNADGSAMSRLDRFLLSDGFIEKGGISNQWIGDCDISDHCPIWLVCSKLDWGPKPFKFNNCWLQHPNFIPFVAETWKNLEVKGEDWLQGVAEIKKEVKDHFAKLSQRSGNTDLSCKTKAGLEQRKRNLKSHIFVDSRPARSGENKTEKKGKLSEDRRVSAKVSEGGSLKLARRALATQGGLGGQWDTWHKTPRWRNVSRPATDVSPGEIYRLRLI